MARTYTVTKQVTERRTYLPPGKHYSSWHYGVRYSVRWIVERDGQFNRSFFTRREAKAYINRKEEK